AALHRLAARIAAPSAALASVVQGSHPRFEPLLDGSRQLSDVRPEREDRTRDEHLLEGLLLHRLLQAGGDGEERLSGARLPDDGDELDLVVQEQVESEALLLVARP